MSAGRYSWARPSGVTARLTWQSGGLLQSEPQTAWSDPLRSDCPTFHIHPVGALALRPQDRPRPHVGANRVRGTTSRDCERRFHTAG